MVAQQYIVEVAAGAACAGWCCRCQTSALLVVDMLALTGSGVVTLGTFEVCTRCDRHLPEAEN